LLAGFTPLGIVCPAAWAERQACPTSRISFAKAAFSAPDIWCGLEGRFSSHFIKSPISRKNGSSQNKRQKVSGGDPR
jgi:hypothetical protein